MSKQLTCRAISATITTLAAAVIWSPTASADVIFSNLPTVLPGNQASIGYQATGTSEMGDHIQFAGGARNLTSATVTMSNWALASTYSSSASGYEKTLTFNIYQYLDDTGPGPLIASKTITTLIPWRPEADGVNCSGTTRWYSVQDKQCYNGLGFNVTFDFSGLGVVLPDDIVFGLAFNTQSYGANPTGTGGPSNSLNYALVGDPNDPITAEPSTGTDVDPDSWFWKTANGGKWLTNEDNANKFAPDAGWSGWGTPAVAFEAVPEPTALSLFGLALAGLAISRRRKLL
ncbi:PEP-CTERM sorting domain-containing protein [Rhodoferax sp. BLA1]|uniref:PEP-CTERM sorting domain-containing protein n=1 Tax=Rhodoferax sp. BLA1 TaxID=2576062 RepID=UPI0015D34E8F|nr:PEP-CTERM sorting domain-containing protein [Rhodoferax sp. BLA1]